MLVVWLPFPDYVDSAGCLAINDLLTQQQNVVNILDILHQTGNFASLPIWHSHPAALMWSDYAVSLCEFGLIVAEELRARKISRLQWGELEFSTQTHMEWATSGDFKMEKPPWFGEVALHLSHKSNLVLRNPVFYSPKFAHVPMDLPLVWPVKESGDS